MVKAQVKAYLAHTFKHRKYIRDMLTPRVNAIGIRTRNPFYEADGTTSRKEVEIADKAEIQGLSTSDMAAKASSGTSVIAKAIELKHEDDNKKEVEAKQKDMKRWVRMVHRNSRKIVLRDLRYIDGTDFTIAYLTDISAGTTCLSMDTEILTIDGWKTYEEINENDVVIGLNMLSGILELTQVIAKKLTKARTVSFLSRTIDMKVSEDHNVIFSSFNSKKNLWSQYRTMIAKDLIGKWWIKIPCAAKIARPAYIDFNCDIINLLGWCLTEGNRDKSSRSDRITIVQSITHEENCNEIRGILNRLNIPYSEFKTESIVNGRKFFALRWRFNAKYLDPLVLNNWKRIPKSILFGASYESLQTLFYTIMKGDGTISRKMIAEPSKDLIEDYQILALMLGKRTNLRPFDGHVYKLYFSDKSDGMVRKALKVSDKEENVWCIQTELGTFIARRNGKPFITHNCEIFYTGVIKRRPVYLLSTAPEVCEHPWIIFATRYGKICKTLDELIKVLERKYG